VSASSIRTLLPPAWPLLSPLIAESRDEGYRFLLRLRDEYCAGQTCFDGDGEALLGVFEGGALVALGGVTRDPYARESDVGRLRHLYVARARRGQGLGRRLVAALETHARPAFRTLRLRTHSSGAACFYERLGYGRLEAVWSATHSRELK
jgi:GNAT superfamily N-acetyltransferase